MSDAVANSPSLAGVADRLGRVYTALVAAKQVPLGAWALPLWIEPARLRPLGGFGIGMPAYIGLSAVYGDALPHSESQLSRYRQEYEADLHVFVDKLAPALSRVVDEGLSRQEQELRDLQRRFNRPGMADRLHESAVRIARASRGIRPTKEDLQVIDSKRIMPLFAAESSEFREQYEFIEGRNPVTRKRILQAVRQERDVLVAGTAPALDPREARAKDEAAEISALLAVIVVHPHAFEILRLYADSPLKGGERLNSDILASASAMKDLRDRLLATPEDAWGYAPLVVRAVAALGLLSVPGFPEFSVAVGRLLSKTKTDSLLSAASMLVVALTLVFTGPVGAVVVGAIDLALAGTDVAIVMLRAYKQDIDATASDFTPEEQRLADHARSEDLSLAIAGALLSAISLAGAARQLLRTRLRAPEILRTEAQYAGKPLTLNPADNRETFFPRFGDEARQARSLGDPNVISASRMTERSRAVGKTNRVGGLTQGQLETRARRPQGTKTQPNFGLEERVPTYDLESAAISEPAAPPTPHDYQDYHAISPEQLESHPPVQETPNRFSSSRELTQADLEHFALPPDLEALYERQRVSPREQVTGVFRREPNPVFFKERTDRALAAGASDPLAPHIKFSAKDPPVVDHIVAVNLIRKFEGFSELSSAAQQQVLHMENNLLVVSEGVNASRGDMPFSLWQGTKDFKLSPDIRAGMIARERALAIEIQDKINRLLAEQRKIRGTVRPFSGASTVGLRLTGDSFRGLKRSEGEQSRDSLAH